jgi:hypothetical protein
MAGRQEQVRMAGSLKTLGYSELRTTDLPLQIRNQSRIKMDRPVKKNNWKFRAGIILMIVSVPPFLAIPVIPFLDMESRIKITVSTVLLILGEVLFWSGGLLVGKELFTKYKSRMNPKNWFRIKSGDR